MKPSQKKRPLSEPKRRALEALSADWQHAPFGTTSGTLISLERAGLIERRTTPGVSPQDHLYSDKSEAYQWRRIQKP